MAEFSDEVRAVVKQAYSLFMTPNRTEIVTDEQGAPLLNVTDQQFQVLFRVGPGHKERSNERLAAERWWREVAKALLRLNVGSSWDLYLGQQLMLDRRGELCYAWNFVFTPKGDFAEDLLEVVSVIEEVGKGDDHNRISIDTIPVGPADRNRPSGVTRFGKPSQRGALYGVQE